MRKTVRRKRGRRGPKLSVKRFTATAPLGDKAYATLKFVNSTVLPATAAGTGSIALTAVYNDLSNIRNNLGLAPGLVDYANTFLDYRITGFRLIMEYFPDPNSDSIQMMYGYIGTEPIPNLNFRELPERRFVKTRAINGSLAGAPARLVYSATVRQIETGTANNVLDFSGLTTLSDPYASSPTELVRLSAGLSSLRPGGYAAAVGSMGVMKLTMFVKVVYWNRRQRTHA